MFHCVPSVVLLRVIGFACVPVMVNAPSTVCVLPAPNEIVFPGVVQVKSPLTVLLPEIVEVPVPAIVRLLNVLSPVMFPVMVTRALVPVFEVPVP